MYLCVQLYQFDCPKYYSTIRHLCLLGESLGSHNLIEKKWFMAREGLQGAILLIHG